MAYIELVLSNLTKSICPTDKIFAQAVKEVLESVRPVLDLDGIYQQEKVLERLIEPDRVIKFKIVWIDDNNVVQVNRGMRVQFNNALGPYKGGLRFHPTVNEDILKFLAFEQTFKNALTGLPIGGGKGGSDFDPKGKSDREIMKFCYAFMEQLHRYIGSSVDIPAGDIGVGGKEIGYLYAKYKKLRNEYDNGAITGKPIDFGGSLLRKEATGYGVVYFLESMLHDYFTSENPLKDKVVCVSGAGNVAIYTCEKLISYGAKPVTVSDSRGTIYDPDGIDVPFLKELKEESKKSLEEYLVRHPEATYIRTTDYMPNGHAAWTFHCDIAIPCATQNELTETDAKNLHENGCKFLLEGANMPTTAAATEYILKNTEIVLAPAKAVNAGGVATSQIEMSQNASMLSWTEEKVDIKLKEIMRTIYANIKSCAVKYDRKENLILGANIAGFKKVAKATLKEGVI